MKIIFFSDYMVKGGAENVLSENINISKSMDYNVSIFTSIDNKFIRLFDAVFYIFNPVYFILSLFELLYFKPEIIHCYNYYHRLSPSIILSIRIYRFFFDAKTIYSAHDYHLVYPNSGLIFYKDNKVCNADDYIWFRRLVDHRGYIYSTMKKLQWVLAYKIFNLQSEFDEVLAPSKLMARILKINNIKNIKIVRNPIFISNINKNKADKKYAEKVKLVFIGRVSKEKGLYTFIENFLALSRDQQDKFELIICGDGEELNNIKSLVISSHLATKVEFKGFLPKDEINRVISESDCLFMSSIWLENAPLSIFEAGLAGLYLLLPGCGGMKEMGDFFEYSVYYDIKSIESLSVGLDKIIRLKNCQASQKFLGGDLFSTEKFNQEIKESYSNDGC